VLKIFFGEVLSEKDGDIDFLLRLTKQNFETKIMYREFCKFLSKRFIRSFKHAVSLEGGNEADGQKSALE
jgi:hypothetical protein